ncbi:MAG: YbhB/YbcL family Raf kinase inhibitor-like protein [Halolamina sp.]|uniref:YbhB/YbcL family Raf kinase inhibitor-like protein n=1 Tax=Halolamina sp. TaxID=1940283 RepID=UPI002FC328C5
MNRRQYLHGVAAGSTLLAGCGGSDSSNGGGGTGTDTSLALVATPFDDGEEIPPRYTCEGDDVNPELQISGVVDRAETLTLLVDDPDAGSTPFVHWLLWNVPASVETIPESVAAEERPPFADGARQGTNGAGEIGYMGPCPPTGDGTHSYRFRLSAVASTLELAAGADRNELEAALEGELIDSVTLTGTFERA